MTFHDLWQMVKKYWYVVVVLPCACVLLLAVSLGAGFGKEPLVTVTTKIVANSQIEATAGIASSKANEIARDYSGATATAKVNDKSMLVTISVSSPDETTSEECAHRIAEETIASTKQLYSSENGDASGIQYNAQIQEPSSIAVTHTSELRKYIVAAIVGLCAAACFLVLLYSARRPVVGVDSLQRQTCLPVLGVIPSHDYGERLLANIRFAAHGNALDSICVVPALTSASSQSVCQSLSMALERDERPQYEEGQTAGEARSSDRDAIEILCCESLAQSVQAAYTARESSVVVLSVAQWLDSIKAVNDAIEELTLADVEIAGFAFCAKGFLSRRADR